MYQQILPIKHGYSSNGFRLPMKEYLFDVLVPVDP